MKSKEFLDDIKKFSAADLQEKRRAIQEELMKLRFKQAISQLDKGSMLRSLKRNLARVETVLTSKMKAN